MRLPRSTRRCRSTTVMVMREVQTSRSASPSMRIGHT